MSVSDSFFFNTRVGLLVAVKKKRNGKLVVSQRSGRRTETEERTAGERESFFGSAGAILNIRLFFEKVF